MDKNEFEKDLNSYRIHDLRDMARGYGVKSPTSLTKQQIIDEIVAILNGEKEPYKNSSKVGRPPINESISKMYSSDRVDSVYYDPLSGFDLVKQEEFDDVVFNSPYFSGDTYGAKEVELEGIYGTDNISYGNIYPNCLSFENNIKVPLFTAKLANLKAGDWVKCIGKRTINASSINYVVSQILEVNHKSVEENLNTPIFEELKYLPLGEKLEYDKNDMIPFDINAGGSYLLKVDNRKNMKDAIDEITESFKGNNVLVINVNANMISEDFVGENIRVYNIPFDSEFKNAIHAINLIMSSAKRMVEKQKSVVVVFTNIGEALKIRDNGLKEYIDDKLNVMTINWFNKIIACAKNTELGSLTLIGLESHYLQKYMEDVMQFEIAPKFTNSNLYE